MKLIATPETIWLPRWVIEAKPCTSEKSDGDDDRRPEPEPGRAGDGGDGGGGEGGDQHLALEADVEDAGALGVEAGEAAKISGIESRMRRGEDDRMEMIHHGSPRRRRCAGARSRRGEERADAGRNMCSSAPAKRMTRPWMTTIMSRVMRRHVEGEFRAALVEHAEQDRGQDDADGMERPISATAMPTKPAPAVKLELQPVLVAHHRVQRHQAGQRRRRSAWRR